MQDLPGKTAFVTGGASGIGLGIAKALLGAGMNVVIADIRDDHLAAATAELSNLERVLALNVKGVFHLTKFLVPLLHWTGLFVGAIAWLPLSAFEALLMAVGMATHDFWHLSEVHRLQQKPVEAAAADG